MPGWESEIPQAAEHGQKKKKKSGFFVIKDEAMLLVIGSVKLH